MREIKFRAFYKNKMRDVVSIDWRNKFCSLAKGFTEIPLKEVELMQYTGLDDVNGKPIYEGDIVNDGDSGKSFIIYYNQSLATFDLSDVRNTGWLWPFYSTNTAGPYKVIGNKFKNSELLEVTK